MQDYELSILEQYQIDVKSTRKTRGAFFCDTDKGLLLLREAHMSKQRVPALYNLCAHLQEAGYTRVDQIVPNREGQLISKSEDGTTYILKCWFAGRECDIRRNGELLDGVKNLAKLHLLMKMDSEEPMGMEMDLKEEYIRHNREMNKVRKYVRTKSPKGEFELAFLKHYEAMYEWGRAALACVENSKVKTLYQESVKKGQFTHGDYNYHNILMTAEGMGTTNFDKFRQNVQVEDLYYFLRKAMEKHGWNRKLGDHMLNAYSAIKPLSEGEMEYLKLRLIYPEKFWKIADTYYRSNKAWISAKNVEKLKVAITQTEEKSLFLENLFSFHL